MQTLLCKQHTVKMLIKLNVFYTKKSISLHLLYTFFLIFVQLIRTQKSLYLINTFFIYWNWLQHIFSSLISFPQAICSQAFIFKCLLLEYLFDDSMCFIKFALFDVISTHIQMLTRIWSISFFLCKQCSNWALNLSSLI